MLVYHEFSNLGEGTISCLNLVLVNKVIIGPFYTQVILRPNLLPNSKSRAKKPLMFIYLPSRSAFIHLSKSRFHNQYAHGSE